MHEGSYQVLEGDFDNGALQSACFSDHFLTVYLQIDDKSSTAFFEYRTLDIFKCC